MLPQIWKMDTALMSTEMSTKTFATTATTMSVSELHSLEVNWSRWEQGRRNPSLRQWLKQGVGGGGRAMSPTGRTTSIILGTIGSLNRSGLGGVCILYVVMVEVKVEPNNFLIIARHSLDTGTSWWWPRWRQHPTSWPRPKQVQGRRGPLCQRRGSWLESGIEQPLIY